MRRVFTAAAAAALLTATPLAARAADYTIDPAHTHVLFLVDHLGYSKMIGLFKDVSGNFSFDPADITASKLKVDLKTASLETQFTPRDNDLKGADWFNVTEFPDMNFVGTGFAKTGDKTGTITGNLTLLGTTKPLTLNVTFNKAGISPASKKETAGFSATATLKRSDFGLKTFIPYIGDDVSLVIESEGTR
jgi:polyisoprenoid-binding protein YceI